MIRKRGYVGCILAAAAAISGASLSGCYTTTLSSGSTSASPATVEYDDKWHHGLVWGIAEVSGPYDLKRACPHGWSEIKTETSFLNGLVELITFGIYSPQTVTIRCALPPSAEPGGPTPEGQGPSSSLR